VINGINGGSQPLQNSAKDPSDVTKLLFNNPLFQVVGGAAKGAADVLDSLNPLKLIFPNQAHSTIATSKATTTTIATTTQHSTSPARNDPVGVSLRGARNKFGAVLGRKKPTTALAKTTVAPPAGGHGRGFPALMFHIENISENIFEIIGALLHWFDHSEPSYLISRVQSLVGSLEALKDIYLQRDMKGGIGEIPKHVVGILNDIKSLAGSVQKNKNLNVLKLLAAGQDLFKNINRLKDDFIEPVSTTPIPGGLIGNVLHGIEGFGKLTNPHNNPKATKHSNHTGLEQLPGEFGHVIRNAGKFIHTLGEIEEIIQSRDPRSNLLQFIGKFKDLAELCLANDTLDKENILDVLQMVWFPNTTLSKIIVGIGKSLQYDFPKNDIVQSIGILMQQEMLVDLGLNILVRSSDFLRFGNIKYDLLGTFAKMGNTLIGIDLSKLLERVIDIFDNSAKNFEWILKTFYHITDSLFRNTQQLGHVLKLS
jgi:hypothetical protein